MIKLRYLLLGVMLCFIVDACKKEKKPEYSLAQVYCNITSNPVGKGCYSLIFKDETHLKGDGFTQTIDASNPHNITLNGTKIYDVDACFTKEIIISGQKTYVFDPPTSYSYYLQIRYNGIDKDTINQGNKKTITF